MPTSPASAGSLLGGAITFAPGAAKAPSVPFALRSGLRPASNPNSAQAKEPVRPPPRLPLQQRCWPLASRDPSEAQAFGEDCAAPAAAAAAAAAASDKQPPLQQPSTPREVGRPTLTPAPDPAGFESSKDQDTKIHSHAALRLQTAAHSNSHAKSQASLWSSSRAMLSARPQPQLQPQQQQQQQQLSAGDLAQELLPELRGYLAEELKSFAVPRELDEQLVERAVAKALLPTLLELRKLTVELRSRRPRSRPLDRDDRYSQAAVFTTMAAPMPMPMPLSASEPDYSAVVDYAVEAPSWSTEANKASSPRPSGVMDASSKTTARLASTTGAAAEAGSASRSTDDAEREAAKEEGTAPDQKQQQHQEQQHQEQQHQQHQQEKQQGQQEQQEQQEQQQQQQQKQHQEPQYPILPLEGRRLTGEGTLATVASNDRRTDDSGSPRTSAAGSRREIYSLAEVKHMDMAHGRPLDLTKAFVINFRRLLELQKIFAILHELIRSTAIAALTLVAAGDGWQMGYSIMFVIILFGLYGFHAARYDTMDTTDFLHIAAILDDDDGFATSGSCIKNPNRLLKAVALSRRGRRKRASLTILVFAAICLTMWYLCLGSWAGSFSGVSSDAFEEDEFYPTLLLVGTLMLCFCVIFDWFYWRETQCVMSAVGGGSSTSPPAPFDPQKHGVPRSHRLLGLPAMWFTSKEAYDDLRLWISMSQQYHSRQVWRQSTSSRQTVGSKIFPEELAIFALNRQGGGQLANALRNAKLFGVEDQTFFKRDYDETGAFLRPLEGIEEPEALNMRLVFFDSHTGQYYEPEEVPFEGFAHHLSRLASRMSRD